MALNRNRNGRAFKRAQGICARCGKPGELRARRLDSTCYQAARLAGTLADYPLRNQPMADTIEDYKFLAATGENHEQIAKRLGKSPETLRVALWHAKRAASAGAR